MEAGRRAGEEDGVDRRGCLLWAARFTGCSLVLYILMFLAIFAAAAVSLLFFR